MRLTIILPVAVCILMCGGAAYGQEGAAAGHGSEPVALSLEQATKLALENSLEVQIAQYDAAMARAGTGRAESLFDTLLNAQTSYRRDETEQSSSIFGTKTVANNYSLGVSRLLPTGTTLSLSASDARTDTNAPFSTTNPLHEATAGISLSQSLGRNFFGAADRATLAAARKEVEAADYTSLDAVEAAIARVQTAYWQLALRTAERAVMEGMLAESRRLAKIYEDKLSRGTAEEVDVVAMRANVRSRETDLLNADLAMQTARNELLFLLNRSDTDAAIVPADELAVEPASADLAAALEAARANRRDYRALLFRVEMSGLELVTAKSARLPLVDLIASFAQNGIDRDYGQAWSQAMNDDNAEVYVGASVSFPLENRRGRSGVEKARLAEARLLLEVKRLERRIVMELNNAVARVNTLTNEIRLRREIVALQEKKLRQEEQRLTYGRSSPDLIIRYEEDLLRARLARAAAYFNYRAGNIALDRATSVLLGRYWKDTP